MDELQKIPPVTRAMMGLIGLVTLTPLIKLTDLRTWYLDWILVYHRRQYWRLISSFFYAGDGINMLMNAFFVFRNSTQLENARFFRRSSQYAWCLLINAMAILALTYPLGSMFLLGPLLTMLIYLWARDNPSAQMNFFGFVTIPSQYVPHAYLFFDLVSQGLPGAMTNATGILSAHVWLILEAYGEADGGDRPPRRGTLGRLTLQLARFLTQPPSLLRRLLPDSSDPSTGTPTPTGGPGRRAGYGTAYAPRGGAWSQGRGQSLASSSSGSNSGGVGSNGSYLPSFLRNWGSSSGSPHTTRNGPTRDDMLAATERRLRAQAGNSILGQNQARTSSSHTAGLAQSARPTSSTAARSTATTPPGQGTVHRVRTLTRPNDDPDNQDTSSSGGTVAEQRRPAGASKLSDDKPQADSTEHWPGQGQRLGE